MESQDHFVVNILNIAYIIILSVDCTILSEE